MHFHALVTVINQKFVTTVQQKKPQSNFSFLSIKLHPKLQVVINKYATAINQIIIEPTSYNDKEREFLEQSKVLQE